MVAYFCHETNQWNRFESKTSYLPPPIATVTSMSVGDTILKNKKTRSGFTSFTKRRIFCFSTSFHYYSVFLLQLILSTPTSHLGSVAFPSFTLVIDIALRNLTLFLSVPEVIQGFFSAPPLPSLFHQSLHPQLAVEPTCVHSPPVLGERIVISLTRRVLEKKKKKGYRIESLVNHPQPALTAQISLRDGTVARVYSRAGSSRPRILTMPRILHAPAA